MIFAGTGKGMSRVGLLLLQPVKAAIKPIIVQTNASPANDLPMHPPRPVISRGELSERFWKAPSVEARIFFSKLSRVRAFVSRFAPFLRAGQEPNLQAKSRAKRGISELSCLQASDARTEIPKRNVGASVRLVWNHSERCLHLKRQNHPVPSDATSHH